ncbi:hypothetical protein HKX48_009572 [Thoreauomyces humboldtii]|nr:hypothetical protein HKX48_009572 [Thoreauomyces humboldtii]
MADLPADVIREYCRWHIYVHDCAGSRDFIAIDVAALFFSLIVSAIGLGTILWRARLSQQRIWNVEFASYDMFLWWSILGFAIPISVYFIAIIEGVRNAILMSVLQCFPWTIGRSSLWIYLMSMVLSTPRTSINVHIPSTHALHTMLRCFIIAELCGSTPCSAFAGWRLMQGDVHGFVIATGLQNTLHAVQSILLDSGLGTWYFGGQMIRVAQEGREEMATEITKDYQNAGKALDEKLGKAITKVRVRSIESICYYVRLTRNDRCE